MQFFDHVAEDEKQRSHLTRALSSQRVQRRATNVSVKSFLWTDFLLPLHTAQGSILNPPHFLQSTVTEIDWR